MIKKFWNKLKRKEKKAEATHWLDLRHRLEAAQLSAIAAVNKAERFEKMYKEVCAVSEQRRVQMDALIKENYTLTREKWKNVCGSEIFQELKHGKYRHVLMLLQDQQISVGKAAQSIAEIANGITPVLPKWSEN